MDSRERDERKDPNRFHSVAAESPKLHSSDSATILPLQSQDVSDVCRVLLYTVDNGKQAKEKCRFRPFLILPDQFTFYTVSSHSPRRAYIHTSLDQLNPLAVER